MADAIVIKNLVKSFGNVKAVDDLSFKIEEGELFAFLGVNGAGKSTTISIMCKTLDRDGGEVYINGESIDSPSQKASRLLGVVFQNSVLDKSLSVRDNLIHRASLYGIIGKECRERIEELSKLLSFGDFLDRAVGKLSGGQRRKVDIARAIIHRPRILILDEPTTGLDPQTRTVMWKVIEELRQKENMTVLLTTHYMEEASEADFVVIIDGGKLVAEGTPIELKNKYTGDFLTVYGINEEQAKEVSDKYTQVAGGYRFMVKNTAEATALIIKHPDIFTDYEVAKGKMDSVFLAVTGKKLQGDN
jgi:multidrug/hemolysin transport system ATP-binding protein